MRVFLWSVGLCFLSVACGDDDRPRDAMPSDTGSDAADTNTADTDTADTNTDTEVADADAGTAGCRESLIANMTFPAAPGFRRTQVQPDFAFDGEKFWVSLTVDEGEESSKLDVYGVHVRCDGSTGEPFPVGTTTEGNDGDAAVAIGNDRAMFAWQLDDGTGGSGNLDIRVRAFALDGTPQGDDVLVETTLDGAPFTGSMWMAEIAPTADGFVVVGSRAVESRSAFNVFAYNVGLDGGAVGETIDVMPAMDNQLEPSVAVSSAGDVHLAWNAQLDPNDEARHLAIGDSEARPIVADVLLSGAADIAIDPAHPERRLVAVQAGGSSDADIHIVDVASAAQNSDSVGALGRLDIAPQIAAIEDGGAVVFLRNVRGIRNELFVAFYDYDGSTLTIDAPIQVETVEPVATYVPGITHMFDDTYAIVWSEGISPGFKVMTRIVER